MIIVNGKQIADRIKKDLAKRVSFLSRVPKMVVIVVGDDPVTVRFVELKQRFASAIGAEVSSFFYEATIAQHDLVEVIQRHNQDSSVSGLVLQLPLARHLDTDMLCAMIDPSKDIDALSPESRYLAPVVKAIETIFETHAIDPSGKKVVVVGNGRLVGRPASVWLAQRGALVTVVTEKQKGLRGILSQAEIVITGAGVPGLIEPSMLMRGVVLIDAGTSESRGKIAGDALPACVELASLFTPVPGGVGPITIATLFQNLFEAVLVKKSTR